MHLRDVFQIPTLHTSINFDDVQETTVETAASHYYSSDTVEFSGTVTTFNTIADENVEMTPTSADVAVSLIDSDGIVLATETVTADMNGSYSGTVVSPASTRGAVTVLAEATYEVPLVFLGEATQAGQSAPSVIFPDNLAFELSLSTAITTDKKGRPMGHLFTEVTNPDGFADVTAIEVRVVDGDGRLNRRFQQNRFSPINEAWLLTQSTCLKGKDPWTISLTATDSVGNVTTTSSVLSLAD